MTEKEQVGADRLGRLYIMGALALSLVILFVSLCRATLEIVASENDRNVLRQNPIQLEISGESEEEVEEVTYNLPETGLLPTNPFYGFKRLRDFLWTSFSSGPVNKSKTALLIADKKIAESRRLFSDSQTNASFETSLEAIDSLKYSEAQANLIKDNEEEAKKQLKQIYIAGKVYGEIIKAFGTGFDIDHTKYQKVVNEINSFNEEQEKAKENWLY